MIHKISPQSASYDGNSGDDETATQVTDGDRDTEPTAHAEHEEPPLTNILSCSGSLMYLARSATLDSPCRGYWRRNSDPALIIKICEPHETEILFLKFVSAKLFCDKVCHVC